MKILLIIHHTLNPNAGAPGSILRLAESYRLEKHEVEIFSFENLPKKILDLDLGGYLFPFFVAFKLYLDARHFDIIDASTGDIWLWGRCLKKLSRFRGIVATHSHGLEHTMHAQILEEAKSGNIHLSWKYPIYHGGIRLWEVNQSMQCADLVLMLNHEDMNFSINSLGLFPEKVEVVHNGISNNLIDLPIDFSLSGDKEIKIAQIGTYINRKGIKYGTPALNNIMKKYSNVKVTFFGAGCPEDQVLCEFSETIRSRVSVIPYYENSRLPSLLIDFQIKLFPTLSEGFSLALLESMACGLLPIATNIPGAREILKNKVNSIVVPPRNQKAIEDALQEVIADPDYLNRLRKASYSTAQNFSWREVSRNRLSLYKKCLESSYTN